MAHRHAVQNTSSGVSGRHHQRADTEQQSGIQQDGGTQAGAAARQQALRRVRQQH